MKNVTLSMPEELLELSRQYARQHGTTLNELIRVLLRRNVVGETGNPVENLLQLSEEIKINSAKWKWNRDEIYDRKVFS